MIRVIFFGTDRISIPTLQALINDDRYTVVGVVTKPDSTVRGRGHKIDSPLAAKIAQEHKIPVFQPTKLSDIIDDLTELRPDIGALVSYGKIVPQSVIDLFPHGIINFHPSMLPVYRGPSPIETAIMNGDSFTGLTLMNLSAKMDAGDIYYQEKYSIDPDATVEDLYQVLGDKGARLMCDNLIKIVNKELTPIPQDDDLAIYCHMIRKEDGWLDPSTMTARDCYNRWRALHIYPKCRMNINDTTVIVTKLKALDNFAGDVWPDVVPCQNNTALQIIEIISPKSGRLMSLTDYKNGLKIVNKTTR